MKNFDRLNKDLKYKFKNQNLLKQALTHRSYGSKNNERLEFLGDSILNMVIAHALFTKFPQESEGKLSRLRAFLVKGETLASIALEINIGDYLLLGQGELKTGGFRRESILADALEAIFAAIYLDGGISESEQTILALYNSRLESDGLLVNLKDAKTRLQEYLQSQKQLLPTYTLLNMHDKDDKQYFRIKCEIPNNNITTYGEGNSRRKAEQDAAAKLLAQIKNLSSKSLG